MLNLASKIVSFDTESTGLNPYGDLKRWGCYPARPFAFSFCDQDGNTEYFRFKVDPFNRRVIYTSPSFQKIKSILEDKSITKICHNLSFDYKMCLFIGIKLQGTLEDTLFMSHIVTGGTEISYALKPLCQRMMDYPDDDQKDLLESVKQARREGKKLGWKIAEEEIQGKDFIKSDYWLGDSRLCETYARQDAERTMLLFLGLQNKIKENYDLNRTYAREKRLFYVTTKMELIGTRCYPEKLVDLEKFYLEYQKKQQILADKIGIKGMNFKSSKQKSEYFFNKMKYVPLKKTKVTKKGGGGNPSTDGDSLVYFAEKYNDPLAKIILEHNTAGHMLSSFIGPYKRFKVTENNFEVLHPNFRQVGPITGRYSCGDPNLQQSASEESGRRKAEIALRPRELLGPRDGYVWYLPDYSQIEVWVFAFLSGEESMTKALLSGQDFHASVAEMVWGENKDYIERKEHYRKRAKNLMFCKLYGGGIGKIAMMTNSTEAEASKFVGEYNKKFPAVELFMNRMINKVSREGKIINPFGRVYFIERDKAYKSTNYIVQGTSADVLKEAMIHVDNLFETKWKGARILLTIHDELVLEIPEELHCKRLMREIVKAMQKDSSVLGCPVPFPVGMKIAKKYWSHTKDIEFIKEEWKQNYVNPRTR